MLGSMLCLLGIMCFHTRDSPVSHFLDTGLDLWQYLALKKSPHKVVLDLKIHECLYWNDLQTSGIILTPIPPSSKGKLRFFHEDQWYFFFCSNHPLKKSAHKLCIYFKVIDEGEIDNSKWIGRDCKAYLTNVALPPKLRILDCHPEILATTLEIISNK